MWHKGNCFGACLFCLKWLQEVSKNEPKTAAPPKQRPSSSGVNCCARCGMWFKMKHGKTTCDANKPKDLEEYGFEVPERLRETLAPSVAPDAALAMTHHPEEEFVDPSDWRLSSSVNLSLRRSFHHLGHSSPCLERQEHHSPPL